MAGILPTIELRDVAVPEVENQDEDAAHPTESLGELTSTSSVTVGGTEEPPDEEAHLDSESEDEEGSDEEPESEAEDEDEAEVESQNRHFGHG